MQFQGKHQLHVTPEQAWDALTDPALMQYCLDGCKSMALVGPGQYAFIMDLKIGPLEASFNGKLKMSEVQKHSHCTLIFDASAGVVGFGKGTVDTNLTAQSYGCDLVYKIDAQVGAGKIAQLGHRLFDSAYKSLVDEFFKRLDAQLLQRVPQAAAKAGSASQTLNVRNIVQRVLTRLGVGPSQGST